MLPIVATVLAAVVIVYVIRAVKPTRVRIRAGFGKINLLDFEAEAGSRNKPGGAPQELPPPSDDWPA
jgi:hypothetical protein